MTGLLNLLTLLVTIVGKKILIRHVLRDSRRVGRPYGILGPVAALVFSKSDIGGFLNPLYNWKPGFGTKLLGFSIGRGSGALKGLSS